MAYDLLKETEGMMDGLLSPQTEVAHRLAMRVTSQGRLRLFLA